MFLFKKNYEYNFKIKYHSSDILVLKHIFIRNQSLPYIDYNQVLKN